MLKIYRKLFITIAAVTIIALGFFISNQQRALAVSNVWACAWEDSAKIGCVKPNSFRQVLTDAEQLISTVFAYGPLATGNPIAFAAFKTGLTGWGVNKLNNYLENVNNSYDKGRQFGSCAATYVCSDFYYRPDVTIANGYPTFCKTIQETGKIYIKGDDEGCLHFNTMNPLLPWHSNNSDKLGIQKDPGETPQSPNYWALGKIENAQKQAGSYSTNILSFAGTDNCSLQKPVDCKISFDGQFNAASYSDKAISDYKNIINDFNDRIDYILSLQALKDQCEKNAPVAFVTCPIYNGVVNAVSNLIGGQGVTGDRQGLLIDFLTLQPLTASEGGEPVFQQLVGNVVVVANIFYTVIFLILIFSSSLPLGLDNYTIKKTLPKFIGAVIMTQFAYLICGVIIDFFNLLGTIVPNLIFSLQRINPALGLPEPGSTGSVVSGLSKTVVVGGPGILGAIGVFGWILIMAFAFIALIAILVGFLYMVLRYLVLYILILISPLAFAAWVLPGTEKFFTNWWKNFIRLNAMFPLITGMLAVAILLSRVLVAGPGAEGAAGGALTLIGMIIPIVALFLIPRTLKWTTDGMNAIAGKLLGGAAGKMGAGAAAVGKGAKMATKKATDYGKDKTVAFGKRQAAEMGIGTESWRRRQKQKDSEEARSKTKEEIADFDRGQLRTSSSAAAGAAGRNFNSRAQGALRAHIDRLAETKDDIGIAQAMSDFRAAGLAAGLSEDQIEKNWVSAVGSNYGTLKGMNPNFVKPKTSATSKSRAATTIDFSAAGGHAGSATDPTEYIHMEEGDYSSMGEQEIAGLSSETLKSIVTSVGNGEDMSKFKFDQKAVENLLTNPNSPRLNADSRKALATIAATKGWKYK